LVESTLALGAARGVRAGSTAAVDVHVPTADVHAASGRVLDLTGRPLALAEIAVVRDLFDPERPWHRHSFRMIFGTPPVTVASDGSFELPSFAREGTRLQVSGAAFDAFDHPIEPGDDPRGMEVRVPQRARVLVSDPRASHFELRDAQGIALALRDVERPGEALFRAPVVAESREMLVSEVARMLVLFAGDDVLAERPVELAAGELAHLP
jgi:hypothetical protein